MSERPSLDGPHKPATAPHPASGEKYRPELDGIRAFCVIFTVFNHVPGKPDFVNGTVGVDVFFALSGWLITSLLIREYEERGSIDLIAFYIRRIFRILPLYFCTVALYVVLALVGAKSTGLSELRHGIVCMLTLTVEYRPVEAGHLFGHAWTLGIEEKFYLVWPFIMAVFIRKPVAAALAALTCVTVLFLLFGHTEQLWRGYCGLGFGATFSMLTFHLETIKAWLTQHAIAGFLTLLMVAVYIASVVWPHPVAWNLVMSFIGTFLIANLWFRKHQPAAALLSFGWIPWLGRLTYAIYLFQTLCIRLAQVVLHVTRFPINPYTIFVVSYLLSILAAWLAHDVIEKPMINVGKRIVQRRRMGRP